MSFSISPEELPTGTLSFDFYPDLNISEFVTQMRIGGSNIPVGRITPALIDAVMDAERFIMDKLAAWHHEGYTKLSDVPSDQINSESRIIYNWRRAVFCLAAAQLIETNADITTSPQGFDEAEAIMPTATELRRIAHNALSRINEKPYMTIFAE